MSAWVTIGITVFLACVAVSRILSERALRQLAPDEKLRLLDSFSALRAFGMLPIVLLTVLFLAARHISPDWARLWYVLFIGLVAVYAVVMNRLVVARMRTTELPESYVRTFLAARYITLAGVALMALAILLPMLRR